MNDVADTTVPTLGEPLLDSPLLAKIAGGNEASFFVDERVRVRFELDVREGEPDAGIRFEKAGPRRRIFFQPAKTRAAIVTCGGLCPGLNNVIRSAFLELHHNYGVREIFGIRYGYTGLNPHAGPPPIRLTPDMVDDIHQQGGTILGSSRGVQPTDVMVDFLAREGIDVLLCLGGDGTQRGAHDIALEAQRRDLPIAVVGIPKTIDNDILYVRRTFGYTTAIDRSRDVLTAAHAEAKGYANGIAVVRLMGRDSGFVASGAALASQEANFVLIPEVPFQLEGERGLLPVLKRRILARGHALIAVAEGAGQELLAGERDHDASGNVVHKDIGLFLRDRITAYFREEGVPISMKYMDPSYYIRSAPANSEDSIVCDQYARNAVHAAMAGKTDLLVSLQHTYVHLPLALASARRQRIDPDGQMWRNVLSITGQPVRFG